MALSIQTNVQSMMARQNLQENTQALEQNQERLSSGLRINSAQDDPAGLAIADRFTAQIRGQDQAVQNAQDGISLAQTAEGALDESSNMLQRMRELSIQSANSTNSASDREALQSEVNELKQEISRIADNSTFNSKNILDGTLSGEQFQVGANANETIDVSVQAAGTGDIGNFAAEVPGINSNASGSDLTYSSGFGALNSGAGSVTGSNGIASGSFTVKSGADSASISVNTDDSAETVASTVNDATATTGVSADARNEVKLSGIDASGSTSLNMTLNGDESANIAVENVDSSDLTNVKEEINANAGTTGVTAELGADATELVLKSDSGADIGIKNENAHAGDGTNNGVNFDVEGLDGTSATLGDPGGTSIETNTAVAAGVVEFDSTESFSITNGGNHFAASTISSAENNVNEVDVSSVEGANDAISVVDGALQQISNIRSDLGAVQNRFDSTIANLETANQNFTEARSRIQDADIAKEAAEQTQNNIRRQAASSVLAQANQNQQIALQLLGGG